MSYYVFCNGEFYGLYTWRNFTNSAVFSLFMATPSMRVYSVKA
jgi:hypothetical protein